MGTEEMKAVDQRMIALALCVCNLKLSHQLNVLQFMRMSWAQRIREGRKRGRDTQLRCAENTGRQRSLNPACFAAFPSSKRARIKL